METIKFSEHIADAVNALLEAMNRLQVETQKKQGSITAFCRELIPIDAKLEEWELVRDERGLAVGVRKRANEANKNPPAPT